MKKIANYLTTPIFYVNDLPHIGHCYTMSLTDSISRFLSLNNQEVKVQTGTDEHGQKVLQSSESQNINIQKFCDFYSGKFKEMAEKINFCASYPKFDSLANFDCHKQLYRCSAVNDKSLFANGQNFIRTTEGRDENGDITDESLDKGRHLKYVQSFWSKLEKNGWIYKDKYAGWYSVRDEAFFAENELIDGKAPTGAEVVWQEEESYFFRLSEFQDFLIQLFLKHNLILPKFRASEVLSFVSGLPSEEYKQGKFKEGELRDLCISRVNLDWGIPVPGDEKHKVYVWLDALTNYKSALTDREHVWPDSRVIHIIGKDIIRFHSVYWPAFIAGYHCSREEFIKIKDINSYIDKIHADLPNNIVVHGWWTNEGEKISKSLGNSIVPDEEIEYIASRIPLNAFSFNNINTANIHDESMLKKIEFAKKELDANASAELEELSSDNLTEVINLLKSKNELNFDLNKAINSKKSDLFQGNREVAVDYFKYFLTKSMSLGKDSDYSRSILVSVINTDLVNNIGNLISRTIAMIKKNNLLDDLINIRANGFNFSEESQTVLSNFKHIAAIKDKAIEELNVIPVIDEALRVGSEINAFIEHCKPWEKGLSEEKIKDCLFTSYLGSMICLQAIYFAVPTIGGMVFDFLGIEFENRKINYKAILSNDWDTLIRSVCVSDASKEEVASKRAAFFPRIK